MPGRFTNGPEPQPDEKERVRQTLLRDGIFDFQVNELPNGTIEVIVAETADEPVLTALGREGAFTKKA